MRNIIKNLAVVLGICATLGCDAIIGFNAPLEKELRVSESMSLPRFGPVSSVKYCGMPNKETFNLSNERQGAVPCSYSAARTNITFEGYRFQVLSVNDEKIKLRRLD